MRLKIAALTAKILLLLGGLIFIAAGIFAEQVGLDNDPGWGRGRIFITITGLIFCALAAVIQFYPWVRRIFQSVAASFSKQNRRLRESNVGQRCLQTRQSFRGWCGRAAFIHRVRSFLQHQDRFFIVAGILISLTVAVWFFTAGRMTSWIPGTDYFDRLAEGFRAGQLSLLEKPSPELLAMDNPYDWQARIEQGVSFIWDTTLFDGKYFLYWGPVPAMVAAGVKTLFPVRVYDGALIFSFFTGTVLFLALILARLRRKFFPATPAYLLLPLVLMTGLSLPVLYLLIHPNVYETAISSGQFFLLAGLYCLLRGMDGERRAGWWLLAAGFTWGAAVGSRITLAFAVVFLTLIISIYWLKTRPLKSAIKALALLVSPLLLWAVGLGWYNWARFGSVLETGTRYQLSGPAVPRQFEMFISLEYILPNFYSYFIHPPEFTPGVFPFIASPFRTESFWPWFMRIPDFYYYPEPIASLLIIVPAVWLIGLPLIGWLRRAKYWLKETALPRREATTEYKTTWVMLLGGSIMVFSPLMIFISASMRYLADVLPMLTLLTAFSLWWGLDFFEQRPRWRGFLVFLALVLFTAGICFGIFGNFITGDNLIEMRNPELYRKLQEFFSERVEDHKLVSLLEPNLAGKGKARIVDYPLINDVNFP